MPAPASAPNRPFVDVFYGDLLARGIQYFLPASVLTTLGAAEESKPEIVWHADGQTLDWLGTRYSLTRSTPLTTHERKLLKSICKVLSTRYQLLFNAEIAARSTEIFSGLPEDHYVSAFLDPKVFAGVARRAVIADRISEAIAVLRISALSTYEDRRISTGALLFGFQPDACHSLPSSPPGAMPYTTELTSMRSFHRICDGLRTLALVDRDGLMVELVDVAEWAEPYAEFKLPVPSPRRYQTHARATLCGGHVCLVLTPNGEIKIFADGAQVFSFLDGRWHLTDAAEKYQSWENSISDPLLANRLFCVALNLAEGRRGGMFVVLDDKRHAKELVATNSRNRLNYLLHKERVTELSPQVLETVSRIDGSVVLDRNGILLTFGAILKHGPVETPDGEAPEGSRTAAAMAVSRFGSVLKVSEDGRLAFYKGGSVVWEL